MRVRGLEARLAMSRPDIGEEEIEAVASVLRSGTLSLGPCLERFEAEIARYVGTRHAIGVSSGTAGLHLCVRAAGIGPGDEVITSPFGFIASANCILYESATPVFVDIDEESMCLDPSLAAAAVTARTKAILPVHVFGQACDMDGIETVRARHELKLIEDACEALGTEHRGRRVGTFGTGAVFSFYPNKQMTTGEGAVVSTDDDGIAALIRSLRNQGRDGHGAWLTHERLGYNYRLTEMAAAIGLVQLRRLDEMLASRATVADWYRERLADIPGVRLMAVAPRTTRLSWFAAIVRLAAEIDRDSVIERLSALGVPARAYFSPLHLQPLYRELYGFEPGAFPVAERVGRSTMALPFHTRMTEEEVAAVCDALAAAV
jgi:perosamine synthetase